MSKKEDTGTGDSRGVAHPSTNTAWRSLTSLFRWEAVLSPQYGRIHRFTHGKCIVIHNRQCPLASLPLRAPMNLLIMLLRTSVVCCVITPVTVHWHAPTRPHQCGGIGLP